MVVLIFQVLIRTDIFILLHAQTEDLLSVLFKTGYQARGKKKRKREYSHSIVTKFSSKEKNNVILLE